MWVEENLSKFHFRDESKFNLFESNGKHYVHQTWETLNPKCVNKSVKGGGGSVMVCRTISAPGVGPFMLHGRVNASVYQNLLQQRAVLFLWSLPTNFHSGQFPPVAQQNV